MGTQDAQSPGKARPRPLTEAELARLAAMGSPHIDWLAGWVNRRFACAHCKNCTHRCEVLEQPGLDLGLVEDDYRRITGLLPEDRPAAVLGLVQERPELYQALRRCCFCGYCTAACAAKVWAPDRMRAWRALFMQAGLMVPDDSALVMVDKEWHIFSAYRAVYAVGYPEFASLGDVAAQGPGQADTLFFPGCSLVSYAPELIRAIGQWLDESGIAWALTDECCGSPLMSAGLFERSEALRSRLLDQIRAAGITRVLTICPGCGEELGEVMGGEIDIMPLPELLLAHAAEGFPGAGGAGTGAGIGTGIGAGTGTGGTGTSADAGGFPASSLAQGLTFFDSCHDRYDRRHGRATRRLLKACFPHAAQREMPHRGTHTLCCGAGGAVATYDADITQRRVWRIIDEARETGAGTLVTACPTCTYTIAQACLGAEAPRGIDSHHYLELVFGEAIDWPQVFHQLEAMWTGEFGPWLTQTFFS
ncbi:MAG: (Fe-S)-binding protein [Eggerthellaceae bacterium]|nr:(Fe-S)-binding protein [Eggerthellaceae bacterium]